MDAEELEGLPVFADLSAADRREVAHVADEMAAVPGDELTAEGRLAHEFFVILEGTAEVTRRGRPLRTLGPGDFFGEIGLLETERRTATVTATSPMRLCVVFGPSFVALEQRLPELAARVRAAIRERVTV